MIELSFLLSDGQVKVVVNGIDSHDFPFAELIDFQLGELVNDPAPFGKKIFDLLFRENSIAKRILKENSDRSIGLRLGSLSLLNIPWEFLNDGNSYLATEFIFVRLVTPKNGLKLEGQNEATKLLFVPSNPLMYEGEVPEYFLSVESEWNDLVGKMREKNTGIELQKLPPTFDALQDSLAGLKNGIIHFTGHGGEDSNNKFVLYFEQASAVAHAISANQFASVVRGHASLAILSACLSGSIGKNDDSNLAATLAEEGIPYVVGMQYSVPDITAKLFTEKFYHFLFSGETVFEAARQARVAVLNNPSINISAFLMGIPVIYAATSELILFKPNSSGLKISEDRIDTSELIGEQINAFFGRQREMVDIGKLLNKERKPQNRIFSPLTITLHGFGGIGKTSLLIQSIHRFAWRFREGVLAISLEPLPSPVHVIEKIEKFIGLQDRNLMPLEARLENLMNELQGRDFLLALDNFESLVYAKNDERLRDDAFKIYKLLEKLPARGITVITTSREITGMPGEVILEISGLDNFAGGQLFAGFVSQRKNELHLEWLAKLNERIGGHPLALRLLAPLFNKGTGTSLSDFIQHLDTLLPQLESPWNEGLRHDTLKACFDFSFNQLDIELVKTIRQVKTIKGQFTSEIAAPLVFEKTELILDNRGEIIETGLYQDAIRQAHTILFSLWEQGLLQMQTYVSERSTIINFFNIPTALRYFIPDFDGSEKEMVLNNYFTSRMPSSA
jgi:hypothetical protein